MKTSVGVLVVALFVLTLPSVVQAAPTCGPGVDWASPTNCAAGIDRFVSNAWITGRIDDVLFEVHGHGVTTIRRETPVEIIDGPFHYWQIDTEIIGMSLTGVHPLLGEFTIRKPGSEESRGLIRQPVGSPFADSFFDVFFELELPSFGTFHNEDPARVAQPAIDSAPPTPFLFPYDCPPPVETLFLPPRPVGGGCPVLLFDEAGNPVGEILTIIHLPKDSVPEPASMVLFGVGVAGAFLRARYQRLRGRRVLPPTPAGTRLI
jgi:hypothetical protein